MSSTIKNVLCKICLVLIIGFSFLTASYAHAQQQTVVIRVDGDNGSANPPGLGDDWNLDAYKYLKDAIAHASTIADIDTSVHLWVAATDPGNPYRPDRSAATPFGTGNKTATFLLNFDNVRILGGFLPGMNDAVMRNPFNNVTVLTGIIRPSCGHPTAGSCFEANGSIACDNAVCCQAVCAIDPTCCDDEWDQVCADLAQNVCGPCGDPDAGECTSANQTPGCDDADCCETVCAMDPTCCNDVWDQDCANLAITFCFTCGSPATEDCSEAHSTPACNDEDCCSMVCAALPGCCDRDLASLLGLSLVNEPI